MNFQTLKELYTRKKNEKRFHLRVREYKEHYPLVREAVLDGIPLRTVIRILRDEEGAFASRSTATVWQAYRRALKQEGITLTKR